MNKKYLFIVVALLIATLCVQCTKGDNIGSLYGRWKMAKFECPTLTETPDSIFFGFQGETYSYQQDYKSYDWGMYQNDGTTFRFLPMQWDGSFQRIHISEKSPSFHIQEMSSKRIILTRNDSVWTLEKLL